MNEVADAVLDAVRRHLVDCATARCPSSWLSTRNGARPIDLVGGDERFEIPEVLVTGG